ncbi:MAG: glycosyl hydrolase family 28 protein [Prevotella sp.]|jgi:polygalacturonase|nr:glycosyl hydrolase family 28 protein [Prevotella sp.]MCI1282196.1 glycosyl hydrolase family 28 protein [Prevotella sp.]
MKKIILISLALVSFALNMSAAKVITSEKAKLVGDGKTLNTVVLQATIDKLSKKGGGTLRFSPGRYLTGGILLRTGVELYLEKGAVLLGSTNPDDYEDLMVKGTTNKSHNDVYSLALITAYQAKDIKLSGEGTIDGQGREVALNVDSLYLKGIKKDNTYFTRLHRPREMVRPNLLSIVECENVNLQGLRFKSSACWGLVFKKCVNLTITGLDVLDRDYWNNDGIDLVDCQHVVIRDTYVNAADDGLCLKSDRAEDANDDILIENCQVESSASAIKFGTASAGGFRNITIRNIKVKDTFRSAIAIESVDGAYCKNILIENIEAKNTGNPIFLRLSGMRWGKRYGTMEDVVIRNVTCEVPFERPDVGYDMRGPIENTMVNPMPSSITGVAEAKVKNVLIENVTLTYPGQASKGIRYIPLWNIKTIPEEKKSYPEFDMFGELPAYGFYLRHVDGVTFRNVTFKLNGEEFRPAFVLDDAANVKFENITYPKGYEHNQIYQAPEEEASK